MRKTMTIVAALLAASLLLVGCQQIPFSVTYSRPQGAAVGQLTLTTDLTGGKLPEGTVSIKLRGYDRDGALIYEAPPQPPSEVVTLPNVPPGVTTVQVQAQDTDHHVLGEEDVPVK